MQPRGCSATSGSDKVGRSGGGAAPGPRAVPGDAASPSRCFSTRFPSVAVQFWRLKRASFLLSAAGAALPTSHVVGAALRGGGVCLTPSNKQRVKSQLRRPPLSYRPPGCRPSPALPFAVPREPRCGRPCRGSGAMRSQRVPAGQRRAACLPMEAPAPRGGSRWISAALTCLSSSASRL